MFDWVLNIPVKYVSEHYSKTLSNYFICYWSLSILPENITKPEVF